MWKLSDYSVIIYSIRQNMLCHTYLKTGSKNWVAHSKQHQSKLSKSGPFWNVNQFCHRKNGGSKEKDQDDGGKTTFDFSQDAVLKNLRATTAFFHLSFFRLRIESNRLAPKFLSLLESSSRRKAFRFSKLQRSSNMD